GGFIYLTFMDVLSIYCFRTHDQVTDASARHPDFSAGLAYEYERRPQDIQHQRGGHNPHGDDGYLPAEAQSTKLREKSGNHRETHWFLLFSKWMEFTQVARRPLSSSFLVLAGIGGRAAIFYGLPFDTCPLGWAF